MSLHPELLKCFVIFAVARNSFTLYSLILHPSVLFVNFDELMQDN